LQITNLAKTEQSPPKRVGRRKRTGKDNTTASSAEKGTPPGYIRIGFLVNVTLANRRNSILRSASIKEVLEMQCKIMCQDGKRKMERLKYL